MTAQPRLVTTSFCFSSAPLPGVGVLSVADRKQILQYPASEHIRKKRDADIWDPEAKEGAYIIHRKLSGWLPPVLPLTSGSRPDSNLQQVATLHEFGAIYVAGEKRHIGGKNVEPR